MGGIGRSQRIPFTSKGAEVSSWNPETGGSVERPWLLTVGWGGGVKLEEQGLGRSLEKGIPEKRVDVACSWGAKADGVGGLPR